MRPVLEIMFIDFITLALDQLVNGAAKAHFMSGGQLTVPLVLRTQGGAGHRGAAQHSQSLESWLTHVPGLKVVMPSRAGRRRRAARERDRRPEPGRLHREQDALLPQGRACPSRPRRCRSARPSRCARAATSRSSRSRASSHDALAAAERLAAEDGIEAEVIDPRTLVPLDLDAIVASVERTGRLVVAHEAVEHGGFGAEIAAQVQAAAFDYLDAPIVRVGAPFAPIPLSPPLEDAYLPGADEIVAAVRAMCVMFDPQAACVVSGCLTIEGGAVYDYVIVGAGSAGCVLAARLSEDPDVKVAVLEAGGQDSRPEIAMPIAFPMLLKSSVDWDLYGEQEPGLGGRRLYLPRGKVLGGSGSINAMIYIRGNRADFDGWAAGGADGLELRRGAAVLQALRGQRARRGRVPRRRRADERVRQPRDEPADRDDDRGERARGASSTTPTSTAPARRASAASSSRSATGGAARPRRPSCIRPTAGRTST